MIIAPDGRIWGADNPSEPWVRVELGDPSEGA